MKNTKWLIWSIECGMWWCRKGYTSYIEEAGVYTYKEACEILKAKDLSFYIQQKNYKTVSPRNTMLPLL